MGQPANPAANDMLRVPGVVGMDYQSALATLQQAGLNPRVHRIRRETKKYAGQEGTVVKQVPSAGGMAMLGSSVGITVYAPGNTPLSQGYPQNGGAQPYPDAGSGASGSAPVPGDQGGYQGDYPAGSDAGGNASGQSGGGTWTGAPSGYGVAPQSSAAPDSGASPPPASPPQWQMPGTSGSSGDNTTVNPAVPGKPEGQEYPQNSNGGGLLR